ncbi:MAG: hypothetical protein CEE40_11375 [Chloroflexi bacterium B3_Chlor]|nr:MAG: hypothetical protein CEE40_11375 [Chloroflexi bacterium B3_Chlor]
MGEAVECSRRGNLQKYQNRKLVQRFLIWCFHQRVGELVASTGAETVLDVGCGEGFTIERLLRVARGASPRLRGTAEGIWRPLSDQCS